MHSHSCSCSCSYSCSCSCSCSARAFEHEHEHEHEHEISIEHEHEISIEYELESLDASARTTRPTSRDGITIIGNESFIDEVKIMFGVADDDHGATAGLNNPFGDATQQQAR